MPCQDATLQKPRDRALLPESSIGVDETKIPVGRRLA